MADNETACEASNRTFVIGRPQAFSNSRVIERSHNLSPRFGHTAEINNLINGSRDDARDYAVGLLAGSIAIFCFFLLWLVTLVGLKCLGYKRVGFFSGHQVKVRTPKPSACNGEEHSKDEQEEEHQDHDEDEPAETAEQPDQHRNQSFDENAVGGAVEAVVDADGDPEVRLHLVAEKTEQNDEAPKQTSSIVLDENDSHQHQLQGEYEDEVFRVERRLKRIRIVVLLCGLGIVICVNCMCALGIAHLVDSLDSGRSGLSKAEDLAQEAIDLIDVYIERQNATMSLVDALRTEVNGICPNIRQEICTDVTSTISPTCDVSGIPRGGEILVFLNDTRSYIYDKLEDLRSDLEEIVDVFQDAEEASEQFYWAFYVALAFAVPLGVLNVIICCIVVLAWNKKLSQGHYCYRKVRGCFLNGFIVPLFIFLVMMSWIFSMVFVIGSTAAADMCIDSPDDRLTAFLIEREDNFDSVVFSFTLWILNGCPLDAVPDELQNQATAILLFFKTVFDLTSALANEDPEQFEAVCGSDPTIVGSTAAALSAQICLLGVTIFDLQDFFSCQNWHPLYEVIMYNAVCYDGTEGLAWLAGTQFIVVFLTMIMLTLRVAFYEMLSEEEEAALEESRRQFWAGFLGRLRRFFCCRLMKEDHVAHEEDAGSSADGVQSDTSE